MSKNKTVSVPNGEILSGSTELIEVQSKGYLAPIKGEQVWEMTQAQWLKLFIDDLEGNTGQLIKTRIKQNELLLRGRGPGRKLVEHHRRKIGQALADGELVSIEVLRDYPNLEAK
ncbi:hypothetical protein KAR91_52795 [Candidatus Pacearchaeota archaeon]|nr:hypothetical protein [Candidatus Pacearchaeota archaeon]